MTPKEKWDRLTNPKTVDDYGLSMTEMEMSQFPDGQEIIEALRDVNSSRMNEVARMIRDNMDGAIEHIRYGALKALPYIKHRD